MEPFYDAGAVEFPRDLGLWSAELTINPDGTADFTVHDDTGGHLVTASLQDATPDELRRTAALLYHAADLAETRGMRVAGGAS